MKEGLRKLILGATLALAGTLSGCAKSDFEQFASAYKANAKAQYEYLKDKDNQKRLDIYDKKGLELSEIVREKSIKNKPKYFREHKVGGKPILNFEEGGNSYVAPILEERTVDGIKVYLTDPYQFKHSVKTFRGHKNKTNISTTFTDLDGKRAANINLRAIDSDNLDILNWKAIERNHKYFLEGDKRWEPSKEVLYLCYKDTPKKERKSKSWEDNLDGTISHEVQHAKDHESGLMGKLELYDAERRGYLKSLIAKPSSFEKILDMARSNEKRFEEIEKPVSNSIESGLYGLYNVKTPEELFRKITPGDISKGAQKLWDKWYGKN